MLAQNVWLNNDLMGRKRNLRAHNQASTKHEEGRFARRSRQVTTVLIYALPIIAGLLLTVAGMLYEMHKVGSIWIVFAALVVISLAVCLYWQEQVVAEIENPPFAVSIETAIVGQTRDSVFLFCEYNQDKITPVAAALYLRIVNLQSVPADISELRIEVELTKEKWIFPATWVEGKYIPDYMQLVTLRNPPSDSLRLDFLGPRLKPRLEEKPLQSHETVRGWVALDMPPAYNEAVQPRLFRITVKDTAGHKFVALDPASGSDENIGPERGVKWNGKIDLSKHTVKHLADFPPGN